MSVFH